MLAIVLCARIFWLYQAFKTASTRPSTSPDEKRRRPAETPQAALEHYLDELFSPHDP